MIRFAVALFFFILIYKKKIAPALKKKKETKEAKQTAALPAPVTEPPDTAKAAPSVIVVAADYANYDYACTFADFFETQLAAALAKSAEKGAACDIRLLATGTMFVAVILCRQ